MNWQHPLAAVVAACCAAPALADEATLRDEMRYLRERVQLLEEDKTAREADGRFAFGGLIEAEAGTAEPHTGGGSESDVVLATVELWAEATINDWTTAQFVLLYEDDGAEPLNLDQGLITVRNAEVSPFYLAAGQMYVPFGNFTTTVVSDPLTLELAETRETALRVGFDDEGLHGSVYAFNGDVEDGASNAVKRFGADIGFHREGEGGALDVGASWLSSLADTDGIAGADPDGNGDGFDADGMADLPAGIGVYAVYTTGLWTFIGEYVGAVAAFAAADLPFMGKGAQPSAWNVEAGYGFELMGRDASVGLAYQRTREALALELPETRALIAVSVAVLENAAVSLEYAVAEDYGVGSGERGDAVTLQLAAEF